MKSTFYFQEHLGSMARNLKALVTKHSFKERLKTSQTYLLKLKDIIEDVSLYYMYFVCTMYVGAYFYSLHEVISGTGLPSLSGTVGSQQHVNAQLVNQPSRYKPRARCLTSVNHRVHIVSLDRVSD